MRIRTVLVALAVAAMAVAIGLWVSASRRDARRMNRVYGSAEAQAVAVHAERVQAYRLVGAQPDASSYQGRIDDYPITSGPLNVPEEAAAAIAEAILSPETYYWGSARKGCIPAYGVRVSFIRGSDQVDVLFCFECAILLVGHGGHVVGGGSFDNAPPMLLNAVKSLFPDDAAIQALR